MKKFARTICVLVAALLLSAVPAFYFSSASSAATATPAPALDGVHTGPRATGSPTTGANRPTAFRYDASQTVNPGQLPKGATDRLRRRLSRARVPQALQM